MTTREDWRQYGDRFLTTLDEDKDWRSIEAIWRFGGPPNMTRLADVMAASGDDRLALVLAQALLDGTHVAQVPTLPDILHQHAPAVTSAMAADVLERLVSEAEPLPAEYADRPHLIVAWLMRQPGFALDDLAVDITVGDHDYSDTAEPKDRAIERVAGSNDLGGRVVQRLADDPALWSTGAAWTRTADVVGRIGNPKGRAALVRAMTTALIGLPPEEAVQPSPAFTVLMEKHATGDISAAFGDEPVQDSPGAAATVLAVAAFKPSTRDDLVEALAAHQPYLWPAHRAQVYQHWDTADWDRLLTRWGAPGAGLIEPGEVLEAAPVETNVRRIRVAVAQRSEPGDRAAVVAQAALRPIMGDDEATETDIPAVRDALPWDLVTDEGARAYLTWILDGVLTATDRCAVVVAAYAVGRIDADTTAALVPSSERVTAFGLLKPGPARGEFAAALCERFGVNDEPLQADLRQVLAAHNDTFDIIDVIAEQDCHLAFESYDEDRWHDLDSSQKDRLVGLLEAHATLDQEPLLDLIANDFDGPNAPRRARAARRWAGLTEMHSMIPAGVLSLLESNQEDLVQTFTEIAAAIQPRDEGTLVSLKARWINGGKTGASARTALDNVANGIVTSLANLRPPERREHCPGLLHLLGITAAPVSFPTLLSYVGSDAVDDNPELRRAAAAAIRSFIDVTAISGDQLDALGTCVSTENDPTATTDLRNALAAADLGDDAAILGLYDLVDLDPDEVGRTPDELFGTQKHRLLIALKQMRVQRALGEPGWNAYVEQMDLVGEALVRTAYLKFGGSDKVKKQINADRHHEPEYGNLVKAFDQVPGFSPASANLQTLHNIRTTRTSAHHPVGGPLDDDAITQAENALRTAALDILNRLRTDAPALHVVPETPNAGEEVS